MIGDKVIIKKGQYKDMTGEVLVIHNIFEQSLIIIDKLQESFWIRDDNFEIDLQRTREDKLNKILNE